MNSIRQKQIFVIIPAYNEKCHIKKVLEKTQKYVNNIIVIDDGSKDKTFGKIKKTFGNINVSRHEINLGKGAALKTGCEIALKMGADIIVTMDADGQHNPENILKLIKKIEKENLDIVFGSRKLNGNIPFFRIIGNKLLLKIVTKLSGLYISDILSGFRAFTSTAYQKIKWESSDYSVETEMIFNVSKNKLKYGEVEIDTIYKDNYKGMNIINGLKIILNILKWSLR